MGIQKFYIFQKSHTHTHILQTKKLLKHAKTGANTKSRYRTNNLLGEKSILSHVFAMTKFGETFLRCWHQITVKQGPVYSKTDE